MSQAVVVAARAFEEALEELAEKEHLALEDPAHLGRRAALLALSGAVWERHLGPLYDVEQARAVLGVGTRQAVSDLARRGRLLALEAEAGRRHYPAFQFSPSGRPFPEIEQVLAVFAEAVETPYTVASWLVSPQDLLKGDTPAAWIHARRDPVRLLEAARRAAGALAR
jgi:hypothetical protein